MIPEEKNALKEFCKLHLDQGNLKISIGWQPDFADGDNK